MVTGWSQIVCSNTVDGALYLAGANGENVHRLTPSSDDVLHAASWSPDGKRIAYVSGNFQFVLWGGVLGNLAASSIWVMPVSGGTPVRVTDLSHLNTSPVWTTDGRSILFVSTFGGSRDIYTLGISGNSGAIGTPVRLTTGLNPHTISLSADGQHLAYSTFATTANLWSASLHGMDPIPPTMRQITFGNQTIEAMAVSPDGRLLAYDSNVNGEFRHLRGAGHGRRSSAADARSGGRFLARLVARRIADRIPQLPKRDARHFHDVSDGSHVSTVVATPKQERIASWSPTAAASSMK